MGSEIVFLIKMLCICSYTYTCAHIHFWESVGWQESSVLFWFWREVVLLLGSLILLVLYPGMSITWGCQRKRRFSVVNPHVFSTCCLPIAHIPLPECVTHKNKSQRKTIAIAMQMRVTNNMTFPLSLVESL